MCTPACRACVRAVRAFVCRGASLTSLFLCGFSTLLPLPCVWYGLFREPSLCARGWVCGRAHSPCVHQLVGVVLAKRKVGVGRGDGQVVRTTRAVNLLCLARVSLQISCQTHKHARTALEGSAAGAAVCPFYANGCCRALSLRCVDVGLHRRRSCWGVHPVPHVLTACLPFVALIFQVTSTVLKGPQRMRERNTMRIAFAVAALAVSSNPPSLPEPCDGHTHTHMHHHHHH